MAKNRQIHNDSFILFTLDELVPKEHLVRELNEFIDWDFIYTLCDPLYSDLGANRVDPVVLFKMIFINIIFGIHSMRKTCKEIEVNIAYRWFLGLGINDKVPDHSTFSQNYRRKFKDHKVAVEIFTHIICLLDENGVLDLEEVFIDGTHVKANANKNKYTNKEIEIAAKFYHDELEKEINQDRIAHGKKTLKNIKKKEIPDTKESKASTTDPDCGYFHKGEKEKCFAYNANTACDGHGYVLGMALYPGNIHDSQAFEGLYYTLQGMYTNRIDYIVADAGYVTPTICKIIDDNDQVFVGPYKRPVTKKEFFKKYEYVYDEYYDCYLCPNDKILKYSTTNKTGYKEYKSNPEDCKECPMKTKCTESKNNQKLVTRHIWEEQKEKFTLDFRATPTWKAIYPKRKETIERVFADGKRKHGLDYTLYTGEEAVGFNLHLIYAGMNIKKFCRHMKRMRDKYAQNYSFEHQSEEVKAIMGLI